MRTGRRKEPLSLTEEDWDISPCAGSAMKAVAESVDTKADHTRESAKK